MTRLEDELVQLRALVAELRAEAEPAIPQQPQPWLAHLVAVASALKSGDELPDRPPWMGERFPGVERLRTVADDPKARYPESRRVTTRPTLRLIQGGPVDTREPAR